MRFSTKWIQWCVLIFFVALITSNCTRDQEIIESINNADTTDTSGNNSATKCDSATITWTNYVKQIVSTNCAVSGCHVSGTGLPVYETYSGFIQKVPEPFRTKALVNLEMPPSGPLPQSTRDSLQMWLDQGHCE